MTNQTISQLDTLPLSDGISIVASDGTNTGRLDMKTLAAKMWDAMYIHGKSVIITCKWCGCHNAITNAACIQCGGPLG